MSELSAMPPKADPSAKPGTKREATSSEAAVLATALGDDRGHEGSWREPHRCASSPTTTTSSGEPNSGATPFLGQVETQPTQ